MSRTSPETQRRWRLKNPGYAARSQQCWKEKNYDHYRELRRAGQVRTNEKTVGTAKNKGMPFSAADDAAILNRSKPLRQTAIEIGRTWFSCNKRRYLLVHNLSRC